MYLICYTEVRTQKRHGQCSVHTLQQTSSDSHHELETVKGSSIYEKETEDQTDIQSGTFIRKKSSGKNNQHSNKLDLLMNAFKENSRTSGVSQLNKGYRRVVYLNIATLLRLLLIFLQLLATVTHDGELRELSQEFLWVWVHWALQTNLRKSGNVLQLQHGCMTESSFMRLPFMQAITLNTGLEVSCFGIINPHLFGGFFLGQKVLIK